MTNLTLGELKPNNTYQKIHAWEAHSSNHSTNNDIHYLFLDVDVLWQDSLSRRIYTIVMQYSNTIGQEVKLLQPAHIAAEDASRITCAFIRFTAICDNNHAFEQG